ncbi:hypothetical protein [Stenoxybacter acetivorans]|uniref:hypothetical protein n=1 Tax=Stenoxybacter acetivorans TaxID=422441 RepID=UPI000569239E|nr:hypothetical protein [Stenoxybacter acetivorans]
MKTETHHAIRTLLVLPSILAYSAVIVYFLKDISRGDTEAMSNIAQFNMRLGLFMAFVMFITIKLREFIFYKFYQNKAEYLDIAEKILKIDNIVFLRILTYIADFLISCMLGSMLWVIALAGFGTKLLK